jgi:spore maturation protein CgeB
MIEIFSKFMDSGLKCGFFINKGLTHEQECDLIYNSKTSLNIHDAYQRALGYDTNERTFKSLGLNGALVSDTIAQLNNLFPNVPTSLDSDTLVKDTKELLSLTEDEIRVIKESNKQNISDNHTYINRVEQLLKL